MGVGGVGVAWVDRFGRRPLLFTGLVGMPVSLAGVGFCFAALENEPEGATSTTVGGIVTVLRSDRMLDEEPAA